MPGSDDSPVCLACGLRPADYLCDFVLGYSGTGPLKTIDEATDRQVTCDAPLCGECAGTHARFLCGSDGCENLAEHFCPVHDGVASDARPDRFTAEQMEGMRNAALAKLRQGSLRIVAP